MYVAKQIVVSAVDDVVVARTCSQCNSEAVADVIAVAHGEGEALYLIGQAAVRSQAAADAVAAVPRAARFAVNLAPCPHCGLREPAAVRTARIDTAFSALASTPGVVASVVAIMLALGGHVASDWTWSLGLYAAAVGVLAAVVCVLGSRRYEKLARDVEARVTFRPD